MYESYFHLSHRPFAAAPRTQAYVPAGSLEQTRQTLVRCIDRAEGPGLVVGPSGTGKTLLCQLLASHFRGRFQVAHLAGARLATRRALLQNILFELKLPYRQMDESELRLSLVDHLEPRSGGVEGLLLLADEAHMLPLRLLEEIRLLTNVIRDGQARVRLVLAGGMALEERLASPKLESFHQRLAARCYLQPLTREETLHYIQEQLRRSGAIADSLLTPDAQAAVYAATDGIPRLVNQVCDHALMLAALGGHRQVTGAGIEEAWADLQQLPLPLREPPTLSQAAGVSPTGAAGTIEFGQLRDDAAFVAETVGPDPASEAIANLESISRTLESLTTTAASGIVSGTAADDFSPASASGTEVELTFHGPHDPFGGHWEHEEVVIDRYASLEDAVLRARRTTSDEGRALGAAISAAAEVAGFADGRKSPATKPGNEPPRDLHIHGAADDEFSPASDPLLPEHIEMPPATRRKTISLRELAGDDRDMIVIDEEQPRPAAPPPGRSRPTEYRQLFSKLRSR
jgi:type II secretory pathway predicted ATPase ExeA